MKIIEWLSEYDAEYNIYSQVLHIYKPMPVKEFMILKIILEPYKYKIKDIIIERRQKNVYRNK